MADMGSLEKMERELKCPICLSLLRSAASVTCNHIFCNDCLMKSMKSASSCPVCKVPFRRREIRPAPHMDNLVSIFKSMEAATGTNVASTQVTSVVEVADGSKRGNSGKKSKRPQKSTAQKKQPSKKEKKTAKAIAASASCPTTKPSFSTSKRIHVTPFPESETPIRPKKIMKPEEPKINLNSDIEEGNGKSLTPDKSGGFSLSPFFWLREGEQEEGCTCTAETISETQSLDTPLRHNAPCFSDIKDSDDEIPLNTTPKNKADVTGLFDSEIFEWTQRPCSPELCSTPLKNQGKFSNTLDQIVEKDDGEGYLGCSFHKLGHASNITQPANAEEMKQKRIKARSRKRNNTKLPNRQNVKIIEADANQQDSYNNKSLAARSSEKTSRATKRNTSSRRNLASSTSNVVPCSIRNSSKRFLSKEDGLELDADHDPLSERPKKKEKNVQQKKCARKLGIAGVSTVVATKDNYEPKSKRVRRMSDGIVAENTKVTGGSGNKAETTHFQSFIKGCTQHKPLDGRINKSKPCGELNSKIELGSMKSNIGANASSVLLGRCQSDEATRVGPSLKNVSVKNKKSVEQSDCSEMENFGRIQACTAQNTFPNKCENSISKVSCAFCQSGDITEVSGEMVHYHNGKQVPAEFNGGAYVIHSHKNCLEWAPDVYFEEDSVFNLTTELTRSKRIKCACCAKKGAALGCFEKTCRKSFHFTCAKLTPECRWDNEHFVMLCPLHPASKLPNESSKQQKQSKRIMTSKGASEVRSSQNCSDNWKWPSGYAQKWALCCSALSAAEKEIVSEFAKLVGVPISTSWSPCVTHVIASTDPTGACKRTLKFLMAILNGKWIVSIDWVKACMDRKEPVDEQKFEVTTDVHGITEGPVLGRQRIINKQPKLFNGLRFYFHGDYTKTYRGYLQDLAVAAGGTVLQRKPVSRDQQKLLDDCSAIIIVYSVEDREKEKSKDAIDADDCRRADAQAMACASGGKVVSSAWIIKSIAACNLQPL